MSPPVISPLSVEDLQVLVPAQFKAFHPIDKLHMLIYPAPDHPIPSSIIDKAIARQTSALNSGRETGNLEWMKATITSEAGVEKAVGGAKWYSYPTKEEISHNNNSNNNKPYERWADEPNPAPWVSSTPILDPNRPNLGPTGVDDAEYVTKVMIAMNDYRKKHFMGDGMLLDLLFVDPEAQGLGVGRELVEWGVKRADERGVKIWVEASFFARGMYEKCGFVVVEDVLLDEGERVGYVFMVKEARKV